MKVEISDGAASQGKPKVICVLPEARKDQEAFRGNMALTTP